MRRKSGIRDEEANIRREEAEAERREDAELRYRLAIEDTAGQLAIMEEELRQVEEGSAEYFDILTQIVQLEERLAKERESEAGKAPFFESVIGDSAKLLEQSQGVKDLVKALDEAFKVIGGAEGKEVKLAPAWQTFADTIVDIGEFAKKRRPTSSILST